MSSVFLTTASALTGLSKRTLWRRIGDGSLSIQGTPASGERTRIGLDDILPLACIPLGADDRALILAADRGDATAQCDLGILLLAAGRIPAARAWFTLAAKQCHPDAMCHLGRCLLMTAGEADADQGVLWLGQAAAKGHPIARALLGFLQAPEGLAMRAHADPVLLETAFDRVEARTILDVLDGIASEEPQ